MPRSVAGVVTVATTLHHTCYKRNGEKQSVSVFTDWYHMFCVWQDAEVLPVLNCSGPEGGDREQTRGINQSARLKLTDDKIMLSGSVLTPSHLTSTVPGSPPHRSSPSSVTPPGSPAPAGCCTPEWSDPLSSVCLPPPGRRGRSSGDFDLCSETSGLWIRTLEGRTWSLWILQPADSSALWAEPLSPCPSLLPVNTTHQQTVTCVGQELSAFTPVQILSTFTLLQCFHYLYLYTLTSLHLAYLLHHMNDFIDTLNHVSSPSCTNTPVTQHSLTF